MRSSVLACYGNFFHGVRHSKAVEIRALACVAAADVRSTTGQNLRRLSVETGVDPREDKWQVKRLILESKSTVPAMDHWRIPCLTNFLMRRHQMKMQSEDFSELDELILSLVTT